jgi:hypothetical protein
MPLSTASPGLHIKSEGIVTVKYTALLGMANVMSDIAGYNHLLKTAL